MKALSLLLATALVGIAVHIETTSDSAPPVTLATVNNWTATTSPAGSALRPSCTQRGPNLFAWMPVVDYFLSSSLLQSYLPDPVFSAARRCA